jgi:PAS domain S-box-containing protein
LKIQEFLKSDLLPVLSGLYDNPHIITDVRGNILFSNKYADELLKNDGSLHNLFDIFSGATSELFYTILNNLAGDTQPVFTKLNFRNGESCAVQLKYSHINSGDEIYTSLFIQKEQLKFKSGSDLVISSETRNFNQELLDTIKKNFPFTLFGKDQVRKKADELNELFWIKDLNGKFILVNKTLANYLGMQPEKIEGTSEEQYIPDFLRSLSTSIIDYIIRSGQGLKLSGILYGSSPYGKNRIEIPLMSRENKVFAIVGMTEPAEVKKNLTDPDYSDLIPGFIAVVDESGILKFYSEDFRQLFNFDRKNPNIHYRKILPPEISSFIGKFSNSKEQEETQTFTEDDFAGNIFPTGYFVSLKKQVTESGINIVIFIDKIKSLDMQESPNQRNKVYDILIQSNPEPVFIYEKENLRFIEVNQSALNLYGFSKNEFLQMDLTDLYAPEDIQTLLGALNEKIREGEFSGPFRQKKKDGTYIFVEISKFALKYGGKESHFNIIRDITEKLESEKQARLFKSAFENTDQLVFITDSSGFIRSVNDAVCMALGYSKDQLVRTAFAALVKDEERGKTNSGIFNAVKKETKKLPLEIKNSQGILVKMNITAAPVFDYKNEIDAFSIIASVVKEEKIKEITKEVVIERIMPAEVHAGTESNNVLLSGVFHEILTPINVILGFVQEITDSLPVLTPEQKEAAEIISQNRMSLLSTMNSIIEYNSLEKKTPDLTLYQITAGEIVDNLQNDFRELTRSRGIEVYTGKISPSLFFETDKSKFTNLLFLLTKIAGYISKDKKIHLSIYSIDREKFAVTFKPGLTSTPLFVEDLLKIFTSGNTNGSDSGIPKLSMKIASRLLGIFKGEIFVSQDNSEVGFTFPVQMRMSQSEKRTTPFQEFIKPVTENRITPVPAVQKKISKETFLNLAGLSCIYIEDQIDSQILFKVQMKDIGDLQFAASFEEALSLMDRKRFDFIVMDINLQGEYNGLDALRIIQKMPEYKNIPVIAVTAYLLQGDRNKFLAAGFHEFVPKPIFRDRMIEALEKVLKK